MEMLFEVHVRLKCTMMDARTTSSWPNVYTSSPKSNHKKRLTIIRTTNSSRSSMFTNNFTELFFNPRFNSKFADTYWLDSCACTDSTGDLHVSECLNALICLNSDEICLRSLLNVCREVMCASKPRIADRLHAFAIKGSE